MSDAPTLRDAAFRALRWTAGSRVLLEILGVASSVVLARLIAPAEFGRAVVALVLVTAAPVVMNSLVGSALVQRGTISGEHVRTAAALAYGVGISLSAMAALAGPIVVESLLDARAARLVLLASPAFVLAGLAVVPAALLQRRLDFRRLTTIGMTGSLVGIPLAVALAAAGAEGRALVLAPLAGSTIGGISLQIAVGTVRPGWSASAARELLGFGLPASIGSLSHLVYRNVDYVLLGARQGPHEVGLYWRAFSLGAEYQAKISSVMSAVALAVLARTDDLAHMRRVRKRMVRTQVAVLFPLLTLLIALAPTVVPFMYGDTWQGAVVPTQILAIGGMIAAVLAGVGPLLLAAGRPRQMAVVGWGLTVMYGVGLYLAAPGGATNVAVATTCMALITLVVQYRVLLQRELGIPLRSLITDTWVPLAGSAAMLAVAWPAAAALRAAELPPPLILLVVPPLGIALYLVLVRAISRPVIDDVRLLVRRMLRGEDAA